MQNRRSFVHVVHWVAAIVLITASIAHAQAKKPNILVIFGDDIGMWNLGAYTHGMMGRTPNIDSIAKASSLPTTMVNQVAPQAEPHSSWVNSPFALA